jgi:hypothetical protein
MAQAVRSLRVLSCTTPLVGPKGHAGARQGETGQGYPNVLVPVNLIPLAGHSHQVRAREVEGECCTGRQALVSTVLPKGKGSTAVLGDVATSVTFKGNRPTRLSIGTSRRLPHAARRPLGLAARCLAPRIALLRPPPKQNGPWRCGRSPWVG